MEILLYKGQPVAYQKIGTGRQHLILIHGFPEDGSIFEKQIAYLKNDFQLIIPDLPGVGQSPFNEILQSVDDFAEVIATIIQHGKIENAIVLGHSMGGYITLALADLYPHLVKAFGFIHSTAYADSAEKKENRRKSILLMENYGSAIFVKKAIPGNFTKDFKEKNYTLIDKLVINAESFSTKGLQRFYQMMIDRPDRTSVLETNKPVFFLIGEEDQAVPISDILPQVKIPTISFVHILSDVAHMGMMEAPEKVNGFIKSFVDYCI